MKYFDLKWFTNWELKQITIIGVWEHTNGMYKIQTINILWLSILGCNLSMSNFVDVAPNEVWKVPNIENYPGRSKEQEQEQGKGRTT